MAEPRTQRPGSCPARSRRRPGWTSPTWVHLGKAALWTFLLFFFLMWDKGMVSGCCHNLSWSGGAGAHRTAQGGHPGQMEHQQAPSTSHPALVLLPCSKEGLHEASPGPRAITMRGMSPQHLGQAAQCPCGSAPRKAHTQPGASQPEKNTSLKTT